MRINNRSLSSHLKARTPCSTDVSCHGSPPNGLINQICAPFDSPLPFRFERNATTSPSGRQRAEVSLSSERVKRISLSPAMLVSIMSLTWLSLSSQGLRLLQTTHFRSGDIWNPKADSCLITSSTVHSVFSFSALVSSEARGNGTNKTAAMIISIDIFTPPLKQDEKQFTTHYCLS